MFAMHSLAINKPTPAGIPWAEVLAAAPEGPDRAALARLAELAQAHPLTLRAVAGAVVVEAPASWQASHGPEFAHAVLLVHDAAALAVRRWLLPRLQP